MVKKRAGLPDSFQLQVQKPVDLGDYLEEDLSFPKQAGGANAPATDYSQPAPQRFSPSQSDDDEPSIPERKRVPDPPRKQVNMKPETLRKAEELLALIQQRGPQKDAAASEMFDAIITALYDAKSRIDLSNVPRRGRWGSPTAGAFVTALSEAFSRAIGTAR